MVSVRYNRQIQVTKRQYHYIVPRYGGIVAYRRTDTNYYIKVMSSKHCERIKRLLTKERVL